MFIGGRKREYLPRMGQKIKLKDEIELKGGANPHITIVKLSFNLFYNKTTSSNSFFLSSNLFEDLS